MNNERPTFDELIREDRMPHIWCPGCGIGPVLHSFMTALVRTDLSIDKTVIVSGIGCTGRVAGYVRLDSFHTTHGRAIPFATGMKLANPDLNVVVFSGDGDLVAIGGNHMIHAARRNMDMLILCVNNFTYGMTGGQLGPTTPLSARTPTSPSGNYERPFNLPYLAAACGAVYVARWTTMHVRRLEATLREVLVKKGFRFVEVIAPCPTVYGRMNRQPAGIDQMRYYRDNCVIQHGADPRDVDIDLNGKIVVGKFLDIERPTYTDLQEEMRQKAAAADAAKRPASPAKAAAGAAK